MFDDDSQIEHMDLVKVRGTTADEHSAVRILPTELNAHSRDTLRETFEVGWGGQAVRNLDDFLEE